MIAEAMEWIVKQARPCKLASRDSREWIINGYTEVRKHEPFALTLTGLEAFISFARDVEEPRADLVAVVDSITHVTLYGILDELERSRECYALAIAGIAAEYPSGKWLEQDTAVRLIQQFFRPTEDRAALLGLVGNLTAGTARTLTDDGITQQATTKRGITKVKVEDVPNPVTLTSYETFAEVDDPERAYIVRLQQEEDQTPTISLHRIPDPVAELETMNRIRAYLVATLPPALVTVL